MRGIIHDQVSHKFIEGPIQSKSVNNNFQEGISEKADYHADLTLGHELEVDVNATLYDTDKPYYEANERYD